MSTPAIEAIGIARAAGSFLRGLLQPPTAVTGRVAQPVPNTTFARTLAGSPGIATPSAVAGSPYTAAVRPSSPLVQLQAAAQARSAAFSNEVGNLLTSSGIDLSTEIAVRVGPNGQPMVTGDHPQKAEIEAILQQAGMTERLRAVLSEAELVRRLAADPATPMAVSPGTAQLVLSTAGHRVQFGGA